MDRTEGIGLAVAILAHIALFVLLSVALIPRDQPPRREAVAVTLTDDIGLQATATDRPAPAAEDRSVIDDLDSMIPDPVEPVRQPRVDPTPPPRPAERRTETPRRETPRERSPPRSRQSRVNNITQGIGTANDTGTSASNAPVSAADRSSIISRIQNAIRPCYNLGALSGTAAEDIVVRLRLRPSRNGSLSSSQISVYGIRGLDASNRQYESQMVEAARAAVLNPRCPLPPLPDALYENGWSDVVLNFIPAQLT